MKKFLLLVFCLFVAVPSAFAAKKEPPAPTLWQKEVRAITSDTDKVYEVYHGMPIEDYKATWKDVPGWTCTVNYPTWGSYERVFEGDKPVREEFEVICSGGHVIHMQVTFYTEDKKSSDWIFNCARAQFTRSFGKDGQIDGCEVIDTTYPTLMTWTGHSVMLSRGSTESKDGKIYRTQMLF
ncbi:MAG: hypothetical protein ACFN1I_00995 [Selenomonas artemidis]